MPTCDLAGNRTSVQLNGGTPTTTTYNAANLPNDGTAAYTYDALNRRVAVTNTLGGVTRYGGRVELRPPLGAGRPPEARDIAAAVHLAGDVALLTAAGLAGLAALRLGRRTRR